jgi:hypothetical protein
MELIIQVTDDATNPLRVNVAPDSEMSAETATKASDGGAPPTSLTDSRSMASTPLALVDIGGPPQWLVDGLAQNLGNGAQSPMATAADTLGADAGEAPSFQ